MGVEFDLALSLKVVCPRCQGGKSEMGYTWNTCPYCEGTGRTENMSTRALCIEYILSLHDGHESQEKL